MAFSANSMFSRHLKTTMLLKSREDFEWPQFSKTSTFEVSKIFSEFFLPFVPFGFCPAASASGPRLPRLDTAAHGSPLRPRRRGGAAPGGRGRRGCAGQWRPWPRRRIWEGKPLEGWDSVVKGTWNEDVDGSSVWWILFSQFVGKFAKTFAPMFGVVLCEHKYIVPTLRVGVSLNQGLQSGNRVAFPSQSKLFLRFRSVHSDVVQVYNQHQSTTACWRFMFWYEDVDGSCFDKYNILLSVLVESICQNICTNICCCSWPLRLHCFLHLDLLSKNMIFRAGVSLNGGF